MKSEKWNNITTTVRTKVELPEGQLLLTEKQWYKKGYVPLSNEMGQTMWTNQHCQRWIRYLFDDEVRIMTYEEKQKFSEEQRLARAKREEKKQRLKKALDNDVEISRLMDNSVCMIRESINKTTLKNYKIQSNGKIVVLDIETTGMSDTDEPLQISVIDTNGKVLYNSLIKPMFHDEWNAAEAIHKISNGNVQNAPYLIEEAKKIADAISGADTIIGYNVTFDIGLLHRYGIPLNPMTTIIDVMELFAPIYGDWSDKFCSYKYQKLTTCAAYYGYDWKMMKAHDSLSDCFATLYCYEKIKEMEEKTNE